MSFTEIIGHEAIKEQMINEIIKDKLAHAHIISGENGIGKSLMAREFAREILGKDKEKQYVDIVEFKVPKGRQTIGIDLVRDEIIVEINKKPYEGDKKVIIIYSADKMTEDAQNSFLKTIEEPPRGVTIILLCENLEHILETIKSRCQIHKLRRLSLEEIDKYLERDFKELSYEVREAIKLFSEGIPGRASKFIQDESFKEIRDNVMVILLECSKKKASEILKYNEFLIKYKNQWQEVLTWFVSYVRDAMLYKEIANKELMINRDKVDSIKELAVIFSFNQLNDIIDIVNNTRRDLERNVNTAMVFDVMLLKLQEV